MKLIYDTERFMPLLDELKKQEVNEEGDEISYIYYPAERLVLEKKHDRLVFLSTFSNASYNRVKSFTIERKNPGLIILSNKTLLHKNEVIHKLLLDKTIGSRNIVFLGQHALTKKEHEFVNKNSLHFFSMKEISHEGLSEVCEAVMVVAKEFSDLYVLIDSHVLEYPTIRGSKPGGMTTRELVYLLQRIKKMHNFTMAELLLNPLDSRVGLKLLSELYV